MSDHTEPGVPDFLGDVRPARWTDPRVGSASTSRLDPVRPYVYRRSAPVWARRVMARSASEFVAHDAALADRAAYHARIAARARRRKAQRAVWERRSAPSTRADESVESPEFPETGASTGGAGQSDPGGKSATPSRYSTVSDLARRPPWIDPDDV